MQFRSINDVISQQHLSFSFVQLHLTISQSYNLEIPPPYCWCRTKAVVHTVTKSGPNHAKKLSGCRFFVLKFLLDTDLSFWSWKHFYRFEFHCKRFCLLHVDLIILFICLLNMFKVSPYVIMWRGRSTKLDTWEQRNKKTSTMMRNWAK